MSTPSADATVVCVLGMSRSGTSLTMRMLSLAGVYLGPEEDLLGGELSHIPAEDRDNARAANPDGFWEHYRLMRLNERILRRFGGNWREPPTFPEGWETSERLDAERDEARALIEETFAGRELWGWKDPRNSLTLPFWQALIPALRHVICLRNPLDVARSLERRDKMPVETGLGLWLVYVSEALANTADKERLLVPYEAYFDDGEEMAGRLARFIGCADGSEQRLQGAIDERLWRQRTPPSALGDDGTLPSDVATLYRLAQRLSGVRAPS
jgi:hypothetical protein